MPWGLGEAQGFSLLSAQMANLCEARSGEAPCQACRGCCGNAPTTATSYQRAPSPKRASTTQTLHEGCTVWAAAIRTQPRGRGVTRQDEMRGRDSDAGAANLRCEREADYFTQTVAQELPSCLSK